MEKKLTKEENECYKMTEREFCEKFYNLDKDELNTKSNKNVFAKNTIMTNIIKHCRGEKERGPRAIDGFIKKLFIPDNEISVAKEHVVKSKIGRIFVNEDILEEYSVRICEIDSYFSVHYEKKKKKNSILIVKNKYCL